MRHLDTAFLWIQSKVMSRELSLHKVATKDNIADVFTKYLAGNDLHRLILAMGVEFREGRAGVAPKVLSWRTADYEMTRTLLMHAIDLLDIQFWWNWSDHDLKSHCAQDKKFRWNVQMLPMDRHAPLLLPELQCDQELTDEGHEFETQSFMLSVSKESLLNMWGMVVG